MTTDEPNPYEQPDDPYAASLSQPLAEQTEAQREAFVGRDEAPPILPSGGRPEVQEEDIFDRVGRLGA